MKSNYSLFQNLPEFNSNRKENFSYKVGDVITNSKGEKATVLRIEQNGKVILQKQ